MAKDTLGKKSKRVAIIGGGHMGSALARGLASAGVSHSRITISDSSSGNLAAAKSADWIFLAVKPSVVGSVLKDSKSVLGGKIIVSLAAGVTVTAIKSQLRGVNCSIARIMPNIPVAYGEGVIGFYGGTISGKDKRELKGVLSGLGLLVEVKKESELDIITLIAGCGPGIVASFISAYGKQARALGLTREAEALALQTFKGTLTYLERSGTSAEKLVASVATKGGVTEVILKELRRSGFEKTFSRAMQKGYKKIKSIRG